MWDEYAWSCEHPPWSDGDAMTYEEAMECLIEEIKDDLKDLDKDAREREIEYQFNDCLRINGYDNNGEPLFVWN